MGSREEREREKERRKEGGEKERERKGERDFIRLSFFILFIQIYPSTIPKDAGMINEIMIMIILRVSQKI